MRFSPRFSHRIVQAEAATAATILLPLFAFLLSSYRRGFSRVRLIIAASAYMPRKGHHTDSQLAGCRQSSGPGHTRIATVVFTCVALGLDSLDPNDGATTTIAYRCRKRLDDQANTCRSQVGSCLSNRDVTLRILGQPGFRPTNLSASSIGMVRSAKYRDLAESRPPPPSDAYCTIAFLHILNRYTIPNESFVLYVHDLAFLCVTGITGLPGQPRNTHRRLSRHLMEARDNSLGSRQTRFYLYACFANGKPSWPTAIVKGFAKASACIGRALGLYPDPTLLTPVFQLEIRALPAPNKPPAPYQCIR